MTLVTPTLTELNGRVRTDFDTKLEGADSRVRRNTIDVMAGAHAGVARGLHQNIANRARFFPAPDNPEANARWASLKNIPRKAAVAASGPGTASGTNDFDIPHGSVLVRADGATYVVTADATIAGGVATLAIAAVTAGSGAAMEAGQELRFQSPIAGISAIVVVADPGITGGLDEESEADWCGRIQEALRKPPAGGKADDYIKWAKDVPGVTRAWVEPNWDGLGTVRVLFVMDRRDDIIPAGGDVDLVDAAVQAQRPVTAEVTVAGPTADPLDLTITPTPDTPEVRAAIVAELRDLISREAEPGGTLLITHIHEAISIAAGETDHTLTTPSANVTAAAGHMTVLGDITWPS